MTALLEAQVEELQNRVDHVNADLMAEMKQQMDAQERARALEQQNGQLQRELRELEEGSNGHAQKEEALQELSSQLSRAKANLALIGAKLEVGWSGRWRLVSLLTP